jgi:hypothetical protein
MAEMTELQKLIAEILGRIGMEGASGTAEGDAAIELFNLINSNPDYARELGLGASGDVAYTNTVHGWIARKLAQYQEIKKAIDPLFGDGDKTTTIPGEMTFDEYMAGIGAPQTLAGYGATAPGQRDIMSAGLARQLGPTPTPFLQAAGERMFDPIQAGYTLGSGLGQLPGQWATGDESTFGGDPSETGPGPSFSQYLGMPGVVPTQQTLQDQLRQTAGLFGERPGEAPLGTTQQAFRQSLSEDQGKQFDLAMSSVLQNIPLHLRAPFTRWAQGQFRQERGTTPEQQWLPQFVGRGFSFGR